MVLEQPSFELKSKILLFGTDISREEIYCNKGIIRIYILAGFLVQLDAATCTTLMIF